jgi:hypothetical protein
MALYEQSSLEGWSKRQFHLLHAMLGYTVAGKAPVESD